MSVTQTVLAVAVAMLLVERLVAARDWPTSRGWWPRALLFNVVQGAVVWLAGVSWDGWMVAQRPWSADALGVGGGAALGYLVITFVYYWWHRWRHEVPLLWRWIHQLHHSPRRIEVVTSFYKHPLEIVLNGLLSSAILYLLVGVGQQAATVAVTVTGVAEFVYHWNVKTPHWLGYLIQRPESHCVHHEEGLHSFNYADLPLWDMAFGTFRNPVQWDGRCGFGEQELRVADMLAGVDVNAGPARGAS